jgi:hypothetical protein
MASQAGQDDRPTQEAHPSETDATAHSPPSDSTAKSDIPTTSHTPATTTRMTPAESEEIDRALNARRRRSSIPARLGIAGPSRPKAGPSSASGTPKENKKKKKKSTSEDVESPSAEVHVDGSPIGHTDGETMTRPRSGTQAGIDTASILEDGQDFEEELVKLQQDIERYELDRPDAVRLLEDGQEVNPIDMEEKKKRQEYVWDGE